MNGARFFVLLAAAFLGLSGNGRALTLFADDFDHDTLNPGRQVHSVNGVDMLLTAEPGRLVIKNNGPSTSIVTGGAASLSLDAPAGDFTLETQLAWGSGPTLYISFTGRETLAWEAYYDCCGDDKLDFIDTKAAVNEPGPDVTPPLYLRVRRVSNNYIFETKFHQDDKWVGQKQVILDNTPLKVGIQFPATGWSAALTYVHLEAPAPDGPAPDVAAVSATSAPPGSVVTVSGTNFVPGTSVLLLDGNPIAAIFATPTQALFQVPITATMGSHTVAVQTGSKVTKSLSLTVGSSQPAFSPVGAAATCPRVGDINGDGVVNIGDVTLLLRMVVGLIPLPM